MKNQTENTLSDHNQTDVSLMGHAAGHALITLPESLVLCTRERPILCLLLMLGTLWLGYALYLIKRRYGHVIRMLQLMVSVSSFLSKHIQVETWSFQLHSTRLT